MNEYIYLGIAEEAQECRGANGELAGSRVRIEQRNKFCVEDRIEIMKPDGRNVETQVLSITTEEGEQVESAPHPQQVLYVELDQAAEKYDLLRVRKEQ